MAFSSGSSNRGRDSEQQAAARRNQIRYLRDIGDQESIDRLDEPRRRRPKGWLLFVILAIVVYSGYRAFHPGSPTVAITANCQQPHLAVAAHKVGTGSELPWSATGPDDGSYVLVADGGAVTVRGSTVRVVGGAPVTKVFTTHRCLAHGQLTSPATTGRHAIRLIHIVGAKPTQVAELSLTLVRPSK